jgi:hypothetical protein
MEEILETVVFDSGKSSYRIELIESNNNDKYIAIEHIVHAFVTPRKSVIKIRYAALDQLIKALLEMQGDFPERVAKSGRKSRIKAKHKAEIINRYLNTGLEIETLAVQFDCSVDAIKEFLAYQGIVITSNKLPQNSGKNFWKRKRKRAGK